MPVLSKSELIWKPPAAGAQKSTSRQSLRLMFTRGLQHADAAYWPRAAAAVHKDEESGRTQSDVRLGRAFTPPAQLKKRMQRKPVSTDPILLSRHVLEGFRPVCDESDDHDPGCNDSRGERTSTHANTTRANAAGSWDCQIRYITRQGTENR